MSQDSPHKRTKQEVFDHEFLLIRAKVLEIAAALDRLDRAAGQLPGSDARHRIDQALQILMQAEASDSSDRAEQVQLLFSRDYQAGWRQEFDI